MEVDPRLADNSFDAKVSTVLLMCLVHLHIYRVAPSHISIETLTYQSIYFLTDWVKRIMGAKSKSRLDCDSGKTIQAREDQEETRKLSRRVN